MRINVYSQEITEELIVISKKSSTDISYHGIQMVLHSTYHPPQDDDRSAVTFWLPKSSSRREALAVTFERMADMVRRCQAGTGLG